MITCSIVGCPCEGSKEGHTAMKAYECGFTYRAASVWFRYSDPFATYVSLVPGLAEKAAEKEADYQDMMSDGDHADVIAGNEFTYRVRDLFTPAELMEHRRALLNGEVVCLSR